MAATVRRTVTNQRPAPPPWLRPRHRPRDGAARHVGHTVAAVASVGFVPRFVQPFRVLFFRAEEFRALFFRAQVFQVRAMAVRSV